MNLVFIKPLIVLTISFLVGGASFQAPEKTQTEVTVENNSINKKTEEPEKSADSLNKKVEKPLLEPVKIKTEPKPEKIAKSKSVPTGPISVPPSKPSEIPKPPIYQNTLPESTISKPVSSSILDLINNARQEQKLSVLSNNSLLQNAALTKAKDMSSKNYFSHIAPDGKTDFQFITEAGYKYRTAASNIAKGSFKSQADVFYAWMKSPGHKANILNPNVSEIGYSSYNGYFVLFLSSRN